MWRASKFGLLTALVLGSAAAAPAAEPASAGLPAAEQARLRALIQQMGDPVFKVREAAACQIVQYGRAAEPLLRDGLNDPMAEIRSRCARLLPIALQHDLEKLIRAFVEDKDNKHPTQLAGWERFRELAGTDDTARQLFVDLHRIDNEFLELIERDPASATTRMMGRCQEFMQSRNIAQNIGTTTQVALMLFAVLHPKLKIDAVSQNSFSSGLYTMSFQQRGKEVLKENTAVRKLLVQYILNSNRNVNYQNMYLVANLELKEGVDIARQYLKTSERDPYTRSMAIAILGKIGSRTEMPDILPFLDSTASIGSVQFGNGVQINTQMRDVALASLVMLSGQNASDYNFAYLKALNNNQGRMNINFALSPGMLGFSDDATRTAALKKWRDWYEHDKKKK